jgi:hypothetical protein
MKLQHDALLQRRGFLACGAALAVTPFLPLPALAAMTPPGGNIAFDVWRKGHKIGEHRLSFSGAGDSVTMNAHVQMAVGLGPVTLFRYRHTQIEKWKGGRFDSIETNTVQNGETMHLVAQRTSAGVSLEGGQPGSKMLGASAMPLTHWNRASLGQPLFNPQDGKMMRLAISGQGPAPVMMGDGKQINATRVILSGETSIEDWYDTASAWTGLRAKAKDGSIIEYRRV